MRSEGSQFEAAQADSSQDPISKITTAKWARGGRATALQVQIPELKPQSHHKKKRERKTTVNIT
jgi:hypothetical protein